MAKRVIFTREHALDEHLVNLLAQAGLESIHLPLIHCQENPLPAGLRENFAGADWVFFTSAVAVDFFAPYLQENPLKIATIGPQTSLALQAQGYQPDFESKGNYALDFVREWLDLHLPKQKILLPQSSLSNPILAEQLREKGHHVLAWPHYDTVAHPAGQVGLTAYLAEEDLIWTFASPSAWQAFYREGLRIPKSHKIAVIGTTTAQAVLDSGYAVDLMPEKPSIIAMVAEIIEKEREQV